MGKIPTSQAAGRTSPGLKNLRAVCQRLKNFLPFKEVPTSPAAQRSPRLENLVVGICGLENPHLYLEKIPTSQAAAWRIPGLKNLMVGQNFLPFKGVPALQAAQRSPRLMNLAAEIRGLENPHLHLERIPTSQAASTSLGLKNLITVSQGLKNFISFKGVPTSQAAQRSPRLKNLAAEIHGLENPHLHLEKIPTSQATAWRSPGLKNQITNAKDEGDAMTLVRGVKDVVQNDRPMSQEEESAGEGHIVFHLHKLPLWYPLLILGKFAFPRTLN